MKHKGVRYAIRIGIERGQWHIAIYPPGNGSPEERRIFGSHEDAKNTARSMINSWLKQAIRAEKS
jgi:hypothetical protein